MKQLKLKYKTLGNANMKGMENLNILELVYYWLDSVDSGVDIIHFWGRIFKVFFRDYKVNGCGDIAFVFSNAAGGRKDHFQSFKNICMTQDDKLSIFSRKGFHVNKNAFINLKYLLSWYMESRRCGLNNMQSAGLTAMLFNIKSEGDRIFDLIGNAGYIVTYCDVLPQDYYVTWLANCDGRVTITVEHGFFKTGSHFLSESQSTYFIANTVVGAENAVDSGKKNVFVGGLMSEMFQDEINVKSNKKVFAVLLDVMGNNNKMHENDNRSILQYSDRLAKEYDLKYIIRYHPADENKVVHDITSKHIEYISNRDEKMEDLLNSVDFIIANQSTTYFQAVSSLLPAIRFIGLSGNNLPSIHSCVFQNYEGLVKVYSECNNMSLEDLKKLKKKIIGASDFFEQYKSIFNNIRSS